MSRYAHESTVRTSRTPDECLRAATEELVRLKAGPRAEDGRVTGKLGSGLKVRLMGAMLAPAEWFPLQIEVAVREGGGGREVSVRVEEAFGAGSMAGVGEKVRQRCDQVGAALATRLGARLE